jgi:hypothetical protein
MLWALRIQLSVVEGWHDSFELYAFIENKEYV